MFWGAVLDVKSCGECWAASLILHTIQQHRAGTVINVETMAPVPEQAVLSHETTAQGRRLFLPPFSTTDGLHKDQSTVQTANTQYLKTEVKNTQAVRFFLIKCGKKPPLSPPPPPQQNPSRAVLWDYHNVKT